MRESITTFSARVGSDPMLVQAAGGNVSWKAGDTLWIKASGTWLANANKRDLFVPVSLTPLIEAMRDGRFDVSPASLDSSGILRPSIETLLHALFPHAVVAHLHPVDAIALLVRADVEDRLSQRMDSRFRWVTVPYRRPGAVLAAAVSQALRERPDANIVFMRNHGVIVAGSSVEEVDALYADVLDSLRLRPREVMVGEASTTAAMEERGLRPLLDPGVQHLAFDPTSLEITQRHWPIYPDHVVFLGADAPVSTDAAQVAVDGWGLIVPNEGIYVGSHFSPTHHAMLSAYAAINARLRLDDPVVNIPEQEIGRLMNWDAEMYRQRLARST